MVVPTRMAGKIPGIRLTIHLVGHPGPHRLARPPAKVILIPGQPPLEPRKCRTSRPNIQRVRHAQEAERCPQKADSRVIPFFRIADTKQFLQNQILRFRDSKKPKQEEYSSNGKTSDPQYVKPPSLEYEELQRKIRNNVQELW